jgi:hypothetical protein
MSASRSIQRIPLGRTVRKSLQAQKFIPVQSPFCIRHLHTPLNAVRGTGPSRVRFYQHTRHQRTYATIIHNQKYNEDKLPLTLEITPSCVKVTFPGIFLIVAIKEDPCTRE